MKNVFTQFPATRAIAIEIPAFFIAIELFEAYLNTLQLSLAVLKPHIYWFGILSFGFVYGMAISLLTGSIAALATLDVEAIRHLYAVNLAAELSIPFLLFLAGLAVGMFAHRDKSSLKESQAGVKELAGRVTSLEGDRQRLIEANLVLEKKAVSREDTVLTLYESAQKLSSLQADEIFENLPELLINYLNAESCSIYLHENHQLALITQRHWQSADQYSHSYDRNHPLYKLLQQKMEILTERELEGVDDATLVAPLITREKRLYGLLKIERIAFMDLHPATLQLLKMLSDWTMQAIENAQIYGASKQSQVVEESTGAYTFFYFKERLKREILLSRRYNLKLSVIFVSVTDFDKMDLKIQKTITRIIYRVLEFQFRGDDIIALSPEGEDFQFCLILPFTNGDEAKIGIQRCNQDIIGYEFKPFEHEDTTLLLTWDIVHTDDQSLFAHPIILEVMPEDTNERTDQMIDRILNE